MVTNLVLRLKNGETSVFRDMVERLESLLRSGALSSSSHMSTSESEVGGFKVLPELSSMTVYLLKAPIVLWRPERLFGNKL